VAEIKTPAAVRDDAEVLAARADKLADALFGAMGGRGGAVVSPVSLLDGLAPLMAAARGETAARLRGLFGGEEAAPLRAFAALSGSLRDVEAGAGLLLCRCSALWTSPGAALRPGYRAALEAVGTEMRALDLSAATAATRINAWADARTEGLVPAIVASLPGDAVAIATAALHFAAHWLRRFDPSETQPSAFARPGAPPVEIPFMRATIAEAAYAQDAALHAVLLPYAGGAFEFIALAPEPGEDPAAAVELVRQQEALRRMRALHFASSGSVRVELPRFAISSPAVDLIPWLRGTPLSRVLRADADYGGATGEPWSVSNVFHRAAIRVDESGTEAAAASAVVVGRSIRSVVTRFRAESPFLAAVRHRETQAVVVAALITDPSQQEG
jgi:serpin B